MYLSCLLCAFVFTVHNVKKYALILISDLTEAEKVDCQEFSVKIAYQLFSYFLTKTYVVGTQRTVSMRQFF